MRYLRCLVLLFAVLASCAHAPKVIADGRVCLAPCQRLTRYRVDQSFSAEQRAIIRESMAIWTRASGGRECFAEVDTLEDLVFVYAPDQFFLRPWAPHGWRRYVGLYRDRNIFLVADQFDREELLGIATHEVAHYLGMEHDDSPDSILHPVAGHLVKGELSDHDAAKYCALQRCVCR